MFAVMVCSGCRQAQVAAAGTVRATCRRCGRAFDWKERKVFYQGDDPQEARRVASKVALEVGKAGIEAVAESALAAERERVASIEDVAEALAGSLEFGASDIEEATRRLRFSWSPDRVAEWLRLSEGVFEPRPGRYRWLR
jgi:hypothetical protein